jgi:hypothetical protein
MKDATANAVPVRLRVVNDSVDFHLWAPEAVQDIPARDKVCKIQPAPAMYSHSAEDSQDGIGFMLAVRPQLRHASCEFGIS